MAEKDLGESRLPEAIGRYLDGSNLGLKCNWGAGHGKRTSQCQGSRMLRVCGLGQGCQKDGGEKRRKRERVNI